MTGRRWTDVAIDAFTAVALGLAAAVVFAYGPGGALA